jgi:hypothetical protein
LRRRVALLVEAAAQLESGAAELRHLAGEETRDVTTAAQDKNHRQVIESCQIDFAAARSAVRAAREITEAGEDDCPDTSWTVLVALVPSPPDTIRVSLGGMLPFGWVPPGFRYRWMLALADAALEEARLLREQDRL